MIVWPMKIDKVVAEIFQDRQCCWRTVDELPRAAGNGETSLNDEIVLTRIDARFDKLRIQFVQIVPGKDGFHRAKISPGANQRLVRALAQQKLQRTDDNRFTGTSLARDSDKSRSRLPLELFYERQIFYSQ